MHRQTCPPCPPRPPNQTTTRLTPPRAAPVRTVATIPTRVMAWMRVRILGPPVKDENSDVTAPLLVPTNWKNQSEPLPERITLMFLQGQYVLKLAFKVCFVIPIDLPNRLELKVIHQPNEAKILTPKLALNVDYEIEAAVPAGGKSIWVF